MNLTINETNRSNKFVPNCRLQPNWNVLWTETSKLPDIHRHVSDLSFPACRFSLKMAHVVRFSFGKPNLVLDVEAGCLTAWVAYLSAGRGITLKALFFPLGGFTAGRTKHHGPQVLGKENYSAARKSRTYRGSVEFQILKRRKQWIPNDFWSLQF